MRKKPCGWALAFLRRPASGSRRPRGGPRRSPRTEKRASRRLCRSASHGGQAHEEAGSERAGGAPRRRAGDTAVSDVPERISVREVGPRDGLQNEDPVPTEAKIALTDRLSATGVLRISAASLVRPEAIPQMADADAVWIGIERAPYGRDSALVRSEGDT